MNAAQQCRAIRVGPEPQAETFTEWEIEVRNEIERQGRRGKAGKPDNTNIDCNRKLWVWRRQGLAELLTNIVPVQGRMALTVQEQLASQPDQLQIVQQSKFASRLFYERFLLDSTPTPKSAACNAAG